MPKSRKLPTVTKPPKPSSFKSNEGHEEESDTEGVISAPKAVQAGASEKEKIAEPSKASTKSGLAGVAMTKKVVYVEDTDASDVDNTDANEVDEETFDQPEEDQDGGSRGDLANDERYASVWYSECRLDKRTCRKNCPISQGEVVVDFEGVARPVGSLASIFGNGASCYQ